MRRALAALALAFACALCPAPAALAQGDAAAAREEAREILRQRRYQDRQPPRPLREPLERLGRAVRNPLEDGFEWFSSLLPGGTRTGWALLGALVVGAAVLVAGRLGARRAAGEERRAVAAAPRAPSAAELRSAAERAERDGDLDLALRLRFRAGLLDLDGRGVIELRPALGTGTIAAAVGSPAFDGLVASFEQVAYGGRAAIAEDLRAARDNWPRVIDEKRI